MDLDLLRNDRDAPVVKSQLSIFSQFLSVVSQSSEIISCGGVRVDVIETFDRAPKCEVEKLLRKPTQKAMGQIDMFALLKSLNLLTHCT